MPPCVTAAGVVRDIIRLPIRLGAECSPGSHKQGGSVVAPAAVGQILEIQLAIVGVHWSFQGADRVEALYELIAAGPLNRCINKANTRGISAIQVFALMANL